MNPYKLRRLFVDRGFKVHRVFGKRHHRVEVSRDGGPRLVVVVASSPSDWRFEQQFAQSLRRAEREATTRQRAS